MRLRLWCAMLMKLFGFQKHKEGSELRSDCLVLFVKSKNGSGVSVFLPWMVQGAYKDWVTGKDRFGWRCARLNVVFNMKFKGKTTKLIKLIHYMKPI
jgi:hypothetical protein